LALADILNIARFGIEAPSMKCVTVPAPTPTLIAPETAEVILKGRDRELDRGVAPRIALRSIRATKDTRDRSISGRRHVK
jgi:hypothetical protein